MRTLSWVAVGGCVSLEELNPYPEPDPPPLQLPEASPTTPRQWSSLTAPNASLGQDLELDGEDIYVAMGEQIGHWDGTSWVALTDPVPGLRSYFHRLADDQIYAVVGDTISVWDGTQWYPITDPIEGLQPAFAFLAPTYLFATVQDPGQLHPWVELWNGNEWIPYTTAIEGLSPYLAMREDLYAVVGTAVHRWDGVSWLSVSAGLVGMAPKVYALHDDQLVGLAQNLVWHWDGVEWYQVTDDPGEQIQPNFQIGPTGLVYAIVGQHVARF